MVGRGAGGAIAAAFGAPLTGAFYASELIIGAYSLANAGPIFAAALAATLTTKALLGAPYVIVAPPVAGLNVGDHFVLVALGVDRRSDRRRRDARRRAARTRLRGDARAVLGASRARRSHPGGDGALHAPGARRRTRRGRARLFGPTFRCDPGDAAGAEAERQPDFAPSGFRGGLFFASLFAGALLGKLYAIGVAAALPTLGLDPTACIMAGMEH